jgi:mandelate racemase
MTRAQLTIKGAQVRCVVVPLRRPVVSKVGPFREWPMILIDLYTNEGVVGHSYLEPYLKQSLRYLIPMIQDLVESAKGQPVAPYEGYRRGVGSLHLVGPSVTANTASKNIARSRIESIQELRACASAK